MAGGRVSGRRGLMTAQNILFCRGLSTVSCPVLLKMRYEAGKGLPSAKFLSPQFLLPLQKQHLLTEIARYISLN